MQSEQLDIICCQDVGISSKKVNRHLFPTPNQSQYESIIQGYQGESSEAKSQSLATIISKSILPLTETFKPHNLKAQITTVQSLWPDTVDIINIYVPPRKNLDKHRYLQGIIQVIKDRKALITRLFY